MLEKLKRKFNVSLTTQKILANFFSLSALQAVNYILPLIVLPYITRVLGLERFGLVAFSLATIQYFVLITEFGFNLSATKSISINREDKSKVSQIFFSVFYIKLFLIVVSFIILSVLIIFIPKIAAEKTLFSIAFLVVVGNALFPQWYYQGMENMWYITAFNVVTKTISTIAVFVFVKSQNEYCLYALLISLGYMVSGVVGFVWAQCHLGVLIKFPNFTIIKEEFTKSYKIFLSTVSINLYTTSNSFVLGLFCGNSVLGVYSAAEKIFRGVQYMGMPVFQALFPHFSFLIKHDYSRAVKLFNKLFYKVLFATGFLSFLLFLTAPILIQVVYGNRFLESVPILRILSLIVFSSWGGYYLGIQGMVNFDLEGLFLKITAVLGTLHIGLLIPAAIFFGAWAVSLTWLLTESLIFFFLYLSLKNKEILSS